MSESEPVRVLVVDDSALMRNLISRIVENTQGLVVADKAMNGVFALQKIPRCKPDIIILDLEMPEMNGIEFLKERKRLNIDIPVIILSSIARRGAEITMEALSLGASDFITKPSGSISEDIHTVAAELSQRLIAFGTQYQRSKGKTPIAYHYEAPEHFLKPSSSVVQEIKHEVKLPLEKPVPIRKPGPIEIIAIGISTGGPNALRQVFQEIDPDLKQPIVVVQHMPPGFTYEFAKSLDRVCPLEVKEAEEGDIVKSGRILIAPGDKHITVEKKALATIVHLNSDTQVNGHRPSADVLFESCAKQFQNKTMAIIMTGMGRDGAREIGSIYKEGGFTIGQEEHSCVVYGMPKAAFEYGHLTEQVSLNNMAKRICEVAKEYS